MTTCDGCEIEMTEALYDACGGLCDDCMRLRFACSECGELTLSTDAHATHPALCPDCGESKAEEERQEALDAAKERLDDLVESLKDSDDIAVIREAMKALERLAR